MNLTTESKNGNLGLILKGFLLDDYGQLKPYVFDVVLHLDGEDFVEVANFAGNFIKEYQGKEWVLNGYSDESKYSVHPENTVRFGVNFLGSIPEAMANELKLKAYNRLTAAGGKVLNSNADVKYFKPKDSITVAVNGAIYVLKYELIHEGEVTETCETCQHGKYLLNLAFFDMDKKTFNVNVGAGETVLGVFADNFKHANIGPAEMARVQSVVFTAISV